MIIDYTYFEKGNLFIPIRDIDEREKVEWYIKKYEPVYLKAVLGYDLYKAFIDGTQVNPEQRFLDLLDGGDYEGGHWIGFKNDEKISPLANYVFTKFYIENQYLFMPVGDVSMNVENSQRSTSRIKLVQIWNEMVDYNMDLYYYIFENLDIYPEFGNQNPVFFSLDNIYGV